MYSWNKQFMKNNGGTLSLNNAFYLPYIFTFWCDLVLSMFD